jgi:hypothetical protein
MQPSDCENPFPWLFTDPLYHSQSSKSSLGRIGQRLTFASTVDELRAIGFDYNFYEHWFNLDPFWSEPTWQSETLKTDTIVHNVLSPPSLMHGPASPVSNPSPAPMTMNIDPTRPIVLEMFSFQTGEALSQPMGSAFPSSGAFSPDPLTQAASVHWSAIPPPSQGSTNITRLAKKPQQTRLLNGRRGEHKRHSPYSLENDQGPLWASKARNEASRQGGPPSVFECSPVQNPQSNPLAYSQGKLKWLTYEMNQILEASSQPMPKKAILEAIHRGLSLSEAEGRAFKANNTVNRAK